MTEPLTTEQVRGVLAAACQAIYDAREALSDADRQIGDGDHGVGMGRGFKAAREAVETADLTTSEMRSRPWDPPLCVQAAAPRSQCSGPCSWTVQGVEV